MSFKCVCNSICLTLSSYIHHTQTHFEKGQLVRCCYCSLTQSSYLAFRKHLERNHKYKCKPVGENSSHTTNNVESSGERNVFEVPDSEATNQEDMFLEEETLVHESKEKTLKKNYLRKILELKEIFKIPDSEGNRIFEDILDIFEDVLELDNPQDFIKEVRNITKSTYLQNRYIEKELNYVKPLEIKVGVHKYQYISLSKTLSLILSNERIFKEIVNEKNQGICFSKYFDFNILI